MNGIPPSALWATDDAGFGQVGCVYTAQGFEYEYGGVIIGGDLVWRDDHWETRPAVSRDREIKRARNSDELIRNVYKVLLTRGLRGCIIYSADPRPGRCWPGSASRHCRPLPVDEAAPVGGQRRSSAACAARRTPRQPHGNQDRADSDGPLAVSRCVVVTGLGSLVMGASTVSGRREAALL